MPCKTRFEKENIQTGDSFKIMEEIKVSVIGIKFEGENGFKILKVRRRGGDVFFAIGKLKDVGESDSLILRGDYNIHPNYGKEFIVREYEFNSEDKLEAIRRFLSSSIIKGIGIKTAEKIVDEFGEDSIKILKENPDKLLKVNGIGEKNIKSIKESVISLGSVLDTMLFLTAVGLGQTLSYKVIEEFRDSTEYEIKDNPYILIKKIRGIGFKTADRIAKKIGIPEDSPFRIKSFILYVLETALEEGHTFLYKDELIKKTIDEINISSDFVEDNLKSLLESGEIIIDDGCVYLKFVYIIEEKIVEKLKILKSFLFPPIEINGEDIKILEKRWGMKLDEEQKDTLIQVLKNKVSIITGGPGTGKTTLLRFVSNILHERGRKISIGAPTGRASRRITETTGFDAKTLHRMLEYVPGKEVFLRNKFNPLEADTIIVDESSMIDIFLFYRLIDALSPQAQIIFVGDHYQLPPVGPGYMFRDMVNSGKIKTFYLSKIYRRGEKSLINVNAHKIKNGEFPDIPVIIKENEDLYDFYFIEKNREEDILKTIVELYITRIPERFGIDPLSDKIQILSPMYRGIIGVDNINNVLQKRINPSSRGIKYQDKLFKKGDKIIQLKNDYDKDVFNGDIGNIGKINTINNSLTIRLFDREIEYTSKEFNDISLAYSISIHKSQGSEYDFVIIPIIKKQGIMLQRNLIYTAITRAKKMVIFIGEREALEIAVRNNTPLERNSKIYEKLVKEI
jgi:exodeoxyribonuclease V alpha subunit